MKSRPEEGRWIAFRFSPEEDTMIGYCSLVEARTGYYYMTVSGTEYEIQDTEDFSFEYVPDEMVEMIRGL